MFSLLRYFLTSALCVLLVIGGALFYQRFFSFPAVRLQSVRPAHVYNDSAVSVGEIALRLFYAVPADKAMSSSSWSATLERAARAATAFHALQFHGSSNIQYEIFPEPILLEHDAAFYEGGTSNRGNPRALVGIASEIDRRVFQKNGDLFRDSFGIRRESAYPVMGIVYEGVGASGGRIYESDLNTEEEIAKKLGVSPEIVYKVAIDSSDGFFLLNQAYLTRSDYEETGLSFFYHEFAHAIGLPDQYEGPVPQRDDVMSGEGNFRPLRMTYIDRSLLKGMGVID